MNKKILLWVAAGLAVLAIVGVGVFGVVSAQAPTQTPVPGSGLGGGYGMRGGMKGGGLMGTAAQTFMQDEAEKAFAAKLGLTVEEVTARLKAGETHVKIAESKGITGDAYTALVKEVNTKAIDAALAAGKITQAQADELKTRYVSFPLWGPDLGFKRGVMERFDIFGKLGGLKDEMLKAFADKLGLTVDDVTARIKAGETYAKIAESKGITADKLPAFMQEVCSQAIDAAVKAGTLTQAQADAMKTRMQNKDWTEMWGGKGILGVNPKTEQKWNGFPAMPGMLDKFGMRGFGDGWMHDDLVKAFADKLGLTVDDVTARLKAGETFAKIAESKGITGDAYTTLMKDLQVKVIDAALAAGKITQAQADAMKAMLDKVPGMMWDKNFGKGFGTNPGSMPKPVMPFGGGRRGR